jgi:hypothetical protein
MSIKDFFKKLVNKEIFLESNITVTSSEEIECVELSKTPTAIATQASSDCDIIELTKSIRIHIHY